MSKQIVIVGGGISGLAVLHQLKKRFAATPEIKILLLEKDDRVGGKVASHEHNGFLFEKGPNGFLDNKDSTLRLARELGLAEELLPARKEAAERYISYQKKLHPVPMNPLSFLSFGALSLKDKLRIPKEFLIPKGQDPLESVYDFGCRRLGKNFAELFLDSMVSGIFAGDVKQLNLKEAFPRIYELEQTYGSLFRAMFKLSQQKRAAKARANTSGQPAGTLWSFKKGMARLCEALGTKYTDSIHSAEPVTQIQSSADGYIVETGKAKYFADYLFLCTPAGLTARMLKSVNSELAGALAQIVYAPVAVVGLGYQRSQIKDFPSGFGYLIPSKEGRQALGVLLSSNIFEHRCSSDHVAIQVMLGGARNPKTAAQSQDKLIALAKEELMQILGIDAAPIEQLVTVWEGAIPQYDQNYPHLKQKIEAETAKYKNLFLVGNYLYGIAVNDCTARAEKVVANFQIERSAN